MMDDAGEPAVPSSDGWRDMSTMPMEDTRFLLIEGYCACPGMEADIARHFHRQAGESIRCFRVWVTDGDAPYDGTLDPPDAVGMDRCIQEIESGVYHGIVVVDCSNPDYFQEFEDRLGSHIQKFVHAGGVVAFPCSEGLIVSTLSELFDTTWQISGYYRTTWAPCEENELNVNYSFGNGNLARRILQPFSAKGVSLKNVPWNERCFGVTSDSRTQSLVPFMGGDDVSKPGEPTSTLVSPEDLDPDYDVIIAMHRYGKGCIAYFGDVNYEETTISLLEAYLLSRCPFASIACLSSLEPDVFASILELKEKGNVAFQEGNLKEAMSLYTTAANIFGTSKGSHGQQRDTLVALYTNLALAHFRAKSWFESERYSTLALDVNSDHAKALFRRASARYEISFASENGDMNRLRGATDDLVDMPGGCPETRKQTLKLLSKIEHEQKQLRKRRAEKS